VERVWSGIVVPSTGENNMVNSQITYVSGIPEKFRQSAVDLYDEAFGLKFSLAIKETEDRKSVLSAGFKLANSIGTFRDNKLVGIAGYHGKSGALTSGITYQLLPISCF